MTRTVRFTSMLPAAIVAAVAALSLLPVAQAASPPAPSVPGKIAVPSGNKLFLVGHATGVQIYSCQPVVAGFAWTFVAPRADLVDDHGKLIVTHFAGPTWQAKDGGQAVGTLVDKVTVDATAIPWLLLSTATTPGRLGGTTFIQRIATVGGIAPLAATCNAATAGVTVEVPYTADYYFWKKQGNQAA